MHSVLQCLERMEKRLAQSSAHAKGTAAEVRLRRMNNNHMRLVLGWAVKAWELDSASDRQRMLHAFLEAELLDECSSREHAMESANEALKSACKKLSMSKSEQEDLFRQLKCNKLTSVAVSFPSFPKHSLPLHFNSRHPF